MATKKKKPAAPTAPPTDGAVSWQPNNMAAQTLFSVLTLLAQIPKTAFFAATGAKPMKSLAFFLPGASAAMGAARAATMALQLDNLFLHFGAKYQDSTQQRAVEALQEVLNDGERRVADLAATADRHYLFWKELA